MTVNSRSQKTPSKEIKSASALRTLPTGIWENFLKQHVESNLAWSNLQDISPNVLFDDDNNVVAVSDSFDLSLNWLPKLANVAVDSKLLKRIALYVSYKEEEFLSRFASIMYEWAKGKGFVKQWGGAWPDRAVLEEN